MRWRAQRRAGGPIAALLLLAGCGDDAADGNAANQIDPALANAVTPLPPEPPENLAAPEASVPGIDAPPRAPSPPPEPPPGNMLAPANAEAPVDEGEAERAVARHVHTRYRCDDGTFVDAKLNTVTDTVKLRREGRVLGVLHGQPAASGTWYRGEGHELRGEGRDATFTRPGAAPVHCLSD